MSEEQQQTNQTFYDRISHVYDLIADHDEHAAREAGEQALAVQPGERVLELGFGTGNSLVHLAEAVGPTGHVAGLDVSPGMLEVAKKKLRDKNLDTRCDLIIGDARALPFIDQHFDAVFTSFTLELFAPEDVPKVMAEMKRVLKDTGRVGIVSMATEEEGETPSLMEKGYVWMHRHFPHLVDCRPIDLARVVADAGLQVQSKINLEIWTMPVRVVIASVCHSAKS